MKVLLRLFFCLMFVGVDSVTASLPYPIYDPMPQPYGTMPSPPAPGWNPAILPSSPRYEHELVASACQIPEGMYRYELVPGRDFPTDMAIKKALLKFHVNRGGMAIVTLEIYPEKASLSLSRLLGDEPRRELYVVNSYNNISDLNRCNGYNINIDANGIELHSNRLNVSLFGNYELGEGSLRISGEMERRRASVGFVRGSTMRITLRDAHLYRQPNSN